MTQITKSTMIGELLQIDQNIAPILLNIGMHCLGCPSSQMETVEEAAMVHGIDPDALVKEINDFLAKDSSLESVKAEHQTKRVSRFPLEPEYPVFLLLNAAGPLKLLQASEAHDFSKSPDSVLS